MKTPIYTIQADIQGCKIIINNAHIFNVDKDSFKEEHYNNLLNMAVSEDLEAVELAVSILFEYREP